MSMLCMVYWFVKIITTVDAAPKLWQLLSNELKTKVHSVESSALNDFLSDISLVTNIRRSDDLPGYEGYVFDQNICKEVGDRILCGYDRNIGENKYYQTIDLGNGCRERGDRIECGYDGSFPHFEAQVLNKRTYPKPPIVDTINIKSTHEDISSSLLRSKTIESKTNDTNIITANTTASMISNSLTKGEENQHTKNKTCDTQPSVQSETAIKINTTAESTDPNIVGIEYKSMRNLMMNQTEENYNSTVNNQSETLTGIENKLVSTKLPWPILSVSRKLNESITSPFPSNTATIRNNKDQTNASRLPVLQLKDHTNTSQVFDERTVVNSKQSSKEKSEPYTEGTVADRTSAAIRNHMTTLKSNKSLRKSNDETEVRTICVEQDDRIICYDYVGALVIR